MVDRLEVYWIDAVQDIPDLVIGGYPLDLEHGLGVVEAAALLHEALAGKEGGTLEEETGESGHGEVVQGEALVGAVAGSGQRLMAAVSRAMSLAKTLVPDTGGGKKVLMYHPTVLWAIMTHFEKTMWVIMTHFCKRRSAVNRRAAIGAYVDEPCQI